MMIGFIEEDKKKRCCTPDFMGYGAVFCVKMGQARWPWNVMVREKTGFE